MQKAEGRRQNGGRLASACAVLCALGLGCAVTLTIRGYQFGHSNHTVYLLDALRINDRQILANDWFTTHTLQYHAVFSHMTAALDRAGWMRPAFLAAYLGLVVLLNVAWLLL